jgi:hypothetical protein
MKVLDSALIGIRKYLIDFRMISDVVRDEVLFHG